MNLRPLEGGTFDATFYVGATLVGDRFGANADTVELEGYEKPTAPNGRPVGYDFWTSR